MGSGLRRFLTERTTHAKDTSRDLCLILVSRGFPEKVTGKLRSKIVNKVNRNGQCS